MYDSDGLLNIFYSRTTTTTIVITTHYVEEAREAHRVGMMRAGRLLAENSPARLVATYNQPSLEAVFLALCSKVSSQKSIHKITIAMILTLRLLKMYDRWRMTIGFLKRPAFRSRSRPPPPPRPGRRSSC